MKIINVMLAVCILAVSSLAQAETGVARSMFTSGIDNREPVDELTQLTNDSTKIYFFTEISDMYGHSITHRWEHGGEVRAEVTFNVGAERWRVWSSKNLDPSWTGEWQVSVVDEGGNLLAQQSFNYVDAASAAMEQPAAEPASDAESATDAGDSGTATPPTPPTNVQMQ